MRRSLTLICCTLLVASIGCVEAALSKAEAALTQLSAEEAVWKLCSREVSAVAYASALLKQIEEHACLNTFAVLDPAKVLADAKAVDDRAAAGEDVGPLCGLAFAVKDNIDVDGYPTRAGTPALDGRRPKKSSPIVERLLAANGVVLGKTHMEELAFGLTTINPVYGAVLNPYNNTHDVGGSSGGTAAIVSARGAPAGFCSDTGGSCRTPGAHTGTVGWRPSLGCYNAGGGIVPMCTSRDTVGVIARSAADVLMFDRIFSDCGNEYAPVELKGLKVGVPKQMWKDVGEEIAPAFDAAFKAMEAAGIQLVPFDIELLLKESDNVTFEFLYLYEMPRELSRYILTHEYDISFKELAEKAASPHVKAYLDRFIAQPVDAWPTPEQYYDAIGKVIPAARELWNRYFAAGGFDVVAVPTAHISARPVDDNIPYVKQNGRYVPNLVAYGKSVMLGPPLGIPGISLPVGLSTTGLPVGLMLQSRPKDDGVLLSVATALEKILPATPPPPPKPSCQGCTSKVGVQEVTFDGVGSPLPSETTSMYTLDFEGSCLLKTMASAAKADRSEL